ncbi:agmatine deiminase [Photobacterium lutimaris]|uniref:Putative agmatine deiminase n=1 Tax=Photobacterium lutimaris TaxID=388278 RepID=A0A2T3ILT7_9GAMM|nr:agmatine deiminase [Photobacterium lutimaris]PSU29303.1 agmatine deiminase [Photobacterium lutimaris]TDR70588.1 agmatine deiminase [Photobacterium lutimaris]
MELVTTPRQDGFTFPAEFAPQQAVWLAWPERQDNWRNDAKPAQQAFAEVANEINRVVPVTVAVSEAQRDEARRQLSPSVQLEVMAYNDAWMRDIGPTIVTNARGEKRGISWRFNAWGGDFNGLYSPWSDDDKVAERICNHLDIDHYRAPFVLEGGAIHTDGEGTLYTTSECLLSQGRNPDLTQDEIEQYLADYLGITKVIWLPKGLFNDETDGHIDNLLHVIAPGKVVLSWTDDVNDPQYQISREALRVLVNSLDAKERTIEVIKLPIPGPLYLKENEAAGITPSKGMKRSAGERLGGSYANFLMINKTIFLPELDCLTDPMAKSLLQNALPDHQIVSIPTREVLLGGGNIHCITQQIPTGGAT